MYCAPGVDKNLTNAQMTVSSMRGKPVAAMQIPPGQATTKLFCKKQLLYSCCTGKKQAMGYAAQDVQRSWPPAKYANDHCDYPHP